MTLKAIFGRPETKVAPGTIPPRILPARTGSGPIPRSDYHANPTSYASVETLERPPIRSEKLVPKKVDGKAAEWLAEYAELATAVGLKSPNMEIEQFKRLLMTHDIPVFSLAEVTAYMDAKAAKESKDKCGWEWRPLREKDNQFPISFGTEAERHQHGNGIRTIPASDYYAGQVKKTQINYFDNRIIEYTTAGGRVYDRTIPLHALRKVALIDKHYDGKVALFVSDYALAPAVQYPDPFLMAVIPNPDVGKGEGRFVIDFWDEPGFGLEQMLK